MSDTSQAQEEPESENFLTRKYGPLPGWAWGLGTVVLVYLYLRVKGGSASTTSTTGTGTSTGTSNALSSNLVAVAEPQPVLDGTYQVSVQPAVDTYSNNQTTSGSSTQGVTGTATPSGVLTGADTTSANATQTTQVQPQTQSSSPQTQQTPTSG